MFKYAKDANAYDLKKANLLDAGFDLAIAEEVVCEPHKLTTIETGIHLSLRPSEIAFVRSRSSTAKKGLFIITGVIDAGYTGSIKIQVFNFTDTKIVLREAQRIAQIVVAQNSRVLEEPCLVPLTEVLSDSNKADSRGNKGFGSSGY